MIRHVLTVLVCALLAGGCGRSPVDTGSQPSKPAPGTNQQVFQVKGVVIELEAGGTNVTIKHEAIPNYMPAMTMPFDVKNTNELAGLAAGDFVSFRMIVTDTEGWIDQVRKLDLPRTNAPPTTGPFRLTRDVDPLNEGDVLPEYHFINQFGERISTTQFKGKALAITFLFTRCPFPTYCPLMANNFGAAQKKLLAATNAPENWHLLTISFDPQFDTPQVLKAYATSHGYDPNRWTFVTGDLMDITAIAEQFGLQFWSEDGGISHNLRTAVVNASGRVQKIYTGNQWTSDELVEEMIKAAAVK